MVLKCTHLNFCVCMLRLKSPVDTSRDDSDCGSTRADEDSGYLSGAESDSGLVDARQSINLVVKNLQVKRSPAVWFQVFYHSLEVMRCTQLWMPLGLGGMLHGVKVKRGHQAIDKIFQVHAYAMEYRIFVATRNDIREVDARVCTKNRSVLDRSIGCGEI